MYRNRLALLTLWLTAGLLTSCAATPSDAYVIANDPGSVEHVDGSVSERVILTEAAVERLRVETTPVARAGKRLMVPDTAIFVDPEGDWWVYTSPEPGVYVRHEIAIKGERDGRVLLTAGPRAGTDVVTVGVAELYGIEAEVGH
jgi:hypothetical protein